LCNDAATLVYLASQAVITPHIWLSAINKLNYPDRIIFDLDPSGTNFAEICKAAKLFKSFLEELGLVPFVMTTGSRGLHVNIPIKRDLLFDDVRQIARDIAAAMVQQYPKLLTLEMRKEKREGKIFVDYLRNAWAQTAVAPYAVRAREKAPIATPLDWKEVNSSLTPQKYNISNIFKRISRIGDPWEDIDQHERSVKRVAKELECLKS
jgi:bifunctional non-homologous end joining protein LigD